MSHAPDTTTLLAATGVVLVIWAVSWLLDNHHGAEMEAVSARRARVPGLVQRTGEQAEDDEHGQVADHARRVPEGDPRH